MIFMYEDYKKKKILVWKNIYIWMQYMFLCGWTISEKRFLHSTEIFISRRTKHGMMMQSMCTTLGCNNCHMFFSSALDPDLCTPVISLYHIHLLCQFHALLIRHTETEIHEPNLHTRGVGLQCASSVNSIYKTSDILARQTNNT